MQTQILTTEFTFQPTAETMYRTMLLHLLQQSELPVIEMGTAKSQQIRGSRTRQRMLRRVNGRRLMS